ncbi:unnamed protein product [Heterobilharzia americana]|nr:unnamed protein product [Heterobilharzia americana]
MDADDSAIEETTGAYDSRTVHLSTDISPKLDVIIKRGSVNASANAHVNNHPTVKQSTDGTSSVHLNSSQSNPSSTTIKNKSPPSKRKGPKETKAVGYLVEPPERIEPVQPSKHPQTDIVYIRFLVRPFTAEQLRQMISTHFGSVVDLWLDKIKSSSLVRLQTAELAAKCREGLDGSRWPSMNPRVLRCDYASTDLFEWMKVNGDNNDVQPPKHLLLGETSLLMSETAVSSKTVEKSDNEFIGSTERNTKSTDLRRKLERTNRDLEPTEVTKPRQSEIKDSPVTDMKLAKGEEPAKLLNNLFRKTTATPSIYWLPLTDQQVNRRTKKAVAEKSDDKKVTSRHSSRHSEEPGQRTTRSPFGVTSSPPLPPSNNMSSQSSRKDFNADRSTGSKNSDDKRLPTTKSNDNGRHVSNKKSLQNNALSEDKHSTSECKPKSTAESKSENRDTADKQGRLLKPDAGIAHSSSSKTDKLMDVSRKKEPSSPSHVEKRRPPKTENSDNEIVSSKQSRTAVAPSGDSSVVSDALAAYKRNVVGSQQHRSEYRRRSPSGRRSPPNHRSSFKSSRPESSRAREQGSHCRSNVVRRRSRSNDRRNRSRSTGRRDRSLSDRYRSRN